jgi:hypothetical protein
VPVPSWDTLLKIALATAAGAALLKKFGDLLPGKRALGAAAGLIILLQGKKVSFAGDTDPLEAMFESAKENGQPIPDDLKEAIKKDKALSDLLRSGAKTGNYTEAQRKLNEEFTRLIIENRDKFTDADLQELAKLAEQNKGSTPTGPITAEALRRELDAAKARGGQPKPEATAKGAKGGGVPAPSTTQESEPPPAAGAPSPAARTPPQLPGIPEDLRKRLADDKAATTLVEEIAVEEGAGAKMDAAFVEEVLKVVREEKLTEQDVKEIANAMVSTTAKGATAAELLAALKATIASRKAAKGQAAAPAGQLGGQTPSGGAAPGAQVVSGGALDQSEAAKKKAKKDDAWAAAAKELLSAPNAYASVKSGTVSLLGPSPGTIAVGKKLVGAFYVVARFPTDKGTDKLFMGPVQAIAKEPVGRQDRHWIVRVVGGAPMYGADGKVSAVLSETEFDIQFGPPTPATPKRGRGGKGNK